MSSSANYSKESRTSLEMAPPTPSSSTQRVSIQFFSYTFGPFENNFNQSHLVKCALVLFLNFSFPLLDVAAWMKYLYISRSSAIHPTLQTLAPIHTFTSFSQYLLCFFSFHFFLLLIFPMFDVYVSQITQFCVLITLSVFQMLLRVSLAFD